MTNKKYVMCVDNKRAEYYLSAGEVYEVVDDSTTFDEYHLRGCNGSWCKSRFEEVLHVRVTNATNDNWYKVGERYVVKKTPSWTAAGGEYFPLYTDRDVGIGVGDFEVYYPDLSVQPTEQPTQEEQPIQATIDKHYGFFYTLTEQDKESGVIKVDPYFVYKSWGMSQKDDTGVLFHCLKNISRFGDKNTKEREIVALYKQIKRLAELEGVDLE